MSERSKLVIYPNFDPLYYGFYVGELRRTFAGIAYDAKGFPDLPPFILGLKIQTPTQSQKIIIAAEDYKGWHDEALEWCDVYAKVNIDEADMPETGVEKILAIGPSFGVRFTRPVEAIWMALRTYGASPRLVPNPKEHLANYVRQFRYRLAESAYIPSQADENYVFFAGTLWKNEPQTNDSRAAFIRACRSLKTIRFEGGFPPRTKGDLSGFDDVMVARRYDFSEYFAKIKRSSVVFNTPAVMECHGWKLGEFLALGKAILSTPLTRMMPAPLIHGEHIHFVDANIESIQQALDTLIKDPAYRQHLEHNARAYYDQYLRPDVVIGRILERSHERMGLKA